MKLTAKFTQRAAMSVELPLVADQKAAQVKLSLVTHENQTILLSAGARGERGLAGQDGQQGAPGVVIVALPEVAQIDGGFF